MDPEQVSALVGKGESRFRYIILERNESHTYLPEQYNYVLSAALDSGLAVSAIVIFFALVFPGVSLSWWGNNVQGTTVDGQGIPWKKLAENSTFGPAAWS